MNQQEEAQLRDEVVKAHRAEAAYKEFVKPFVDANKLSLISALENTDPVNFDSVREIHRMILVLNKFNDGMKEYVTTGKLARLALNESKENDSRD